VGCHNRQLDALRIQRNREEEHSGAAARLSVMSRQPPRGAICQRHSGISEREREREREREGGSSRAGCGREGGGYRITESPPRTVVKAMDTNGEAG